MMIELLFFLMEISRKYFLPTPFFLLVSDPSLSELDMSSGLALGRADGAPEPLRRWGTCRLGLHLPARLTLCFFPESLLLCPRSPPHHPRSHLSDH